MCGALIGSAAAPGDACERKDVNQEYTWSRQGATLFCAGLLSHLHKPQFDVQRLVHSVQLAAVNRPAARRRLSPSRGARLPCVCLHLQLLQSAAAPTNSAVPTPSRLLFLLHGDVAGPHSPPPFVLPCHCRGAAPFDPRLPRSFAHRPPSLVSPPWSSSTQSPRPCLPPT